MAAGAIPVEGRVLVRKLIASGLRIPARRRSKALKVPLLNRWNEVLPGHDALFLDLLDRWGEEHRNYHGRTHLLAVLEALDLLADPADPPRTVLLAAWFHDAVYRGIAGQDEEESARLAEDRLAQAGLPGAEVDEVARLVRLTADHRPDRTTTPVPCSATPTSRSWAGNPRPTPAISPPSGKTSRTSATTTSPPAGPPSSASCWNSTRSSTRPRAGTLAGRGPPEPAGRTRLSGRPRRPARVRLAATPR